MATGVGVVSSSAFCLPAVSGGLRLANLSGHPWQAINETQRRFLAEYGEATGDLANLDAYLKGKVTASATELNNWFAEHGWKTNLNFPPNGLGIGSIFDLLVNWLIPGKKKDSGVAIRQGDSYSRYQGVEMSASEGLLAHRIEDYPYPLFELLTQESGWRVFLVEADTYSEAFDLPKTANALLVKKRTSYSLRKLEFPIVEMAMEVDISWIEGMSVNNGFAIDQAMKQVRLRLDDKGARAESAVAYTMRGMESGVYRINRPFYVIFWRDGLKFPAFVALSAPDSWKKL